MQVHPYHSEVKDRSAPRVRDVQMHGCVNDEKQEKNYRR